MEESQITLSDQEVENRLADLLVDFRKKADQHGMNDVDIRMAEAAIRDAYRRGLSDRD